MPVIIPDTLPATAILRTEGIRVIPNRVAVRQDIRPLKVVILNIMPTKQATELQWLRLLGSSMLQVEVTLLRTQSYTSKNVSLEHLDDFYQTFSDITHEYFDALIITGAPVEQQAFESVTYWDELKRIMDWSLTHVYSTLHTCWGALAGLYHHYGVPKYPRSEKLTGIFWHTNHLPTHQLLHGFDEVFAAPHSRYTEVRSEDIACHPSLLLLATSAEAGVHLVSRQDARQVFVLGHPEYDRLSLHLEYTRDIVRWGLSPPPHPVGYYPADDPANPPSLTWRSHATLLVTNWLHDIYQHVSFDPEEIPPLVI